LPISVFTQGQEITRILRNPNFLDRLHKKAPPFSVVSQMKSVESDKETGCLRTGC